MSSARRRNTTQRRSSAKRSASVLDVMGPHHESAMNEMIGRGPITIVLIYSPACPHCHTYMPLWNRLCEQRERRANLVRMEAPVYNQLELSEKKSIDGVPTVLFVDKEGRVSEAESPRDERVMSNAVRLGVSEKEAATESEDFVPVSEVTTSVPGVTMSESELPAIPGAVVPSASVQSGGNPWAAFLLAARQAAPAAVLLGAYSQLREPTKRASGLGRPKTRRRRSRRHSRRRSQQRRH
jgi:hypothetical protein